MGKLLGEILVRDKIITHKQLQYAFRLQNERKRFLGSIIVDLGYLDEDKLMEYLQKNWRNL